MDGVVTVERWGVATDRGRKRKANEDSFLAEPPLFVVADGMGGHAAGDVASRMAVEAFAGLGRHAPISAQEAVDAIEAANRSILGIAAASPDKAGMGTTVTGLVSVVVGGVEHWLVFNVGDSRVYCLQEGHLDQLTVDHSEAEEMVIAGKITREQARTYEHRNVVTRSLGTDPGPVADSWVFPSAGGERFLICSDGLTTELTDDEIERCLLADAHPQRVAEELVRQAVEAGGHDNVTVIVVDSAVPSDLSQVDEDTTPRDHYDQR